MAFPNAPRVVYECNPLDVVICQLRFPAILRIEAEPPARFQETVRSAFPNYDSPPSFQLPVGMPPELARSMFADLGRKNHNFASQDQQWVLTLNREFLSLTCNSYSQWQDFKDRLTGPFGALLQEYRPAAFSRLGLRYRDVIRRSRLGLEDVPWQELLRPWISGVLGSDGVNDCVKATQSNCVIQLSEEIGSVQMTFGLFIEERTNDAGNKEQETVFLIDSDFYNDQQTEHDNVFNRLDALNRQAGLFFRWCITDRLHDALRPGPVLPR